MTLTRPSTRLGFLLLTTTALGLLAPASSPANSSTKVFGTNPSLREASQAWKKGRSQTAIRFARLTVQDSNRVGERIAAYHILCSALTQRGEFDSALRHCDRAVDLTREQSWRQLSNRGEARFRAGLSDAAIADYKAAIALLAASEDNATVEARRASIARLESSLVRIYGSTAAPAAAIAPE